jgi:hypothetical protein
MPEMEGKAMSENDKRCAEALKRLHRYINLACAQHAYMLRGKVKLP